MRMVPPTIVTLEPMRGSRQKARGVPGRRPKIGTQDRLIATMAAKPIPTQMTTPKHLRGMPIVRRRETAKGRRLVKPPGLHRAILMATYPLSKSAPVRRMQAFLMKFANAMPVKPRSKPGAARLPLASVRNSRIGARQPKNGSIAIPIAETVSSA